MRQFFRGGVLIELKVTSSRVGTEIFYVLNIFKIYFKQLKNKNASAAKLR